MSNNVSLVEGVEAHPSGAAFLPRTKTLLVADLHLGYSWAQRRRGELGPLADTLTREKMLRVSEELAPARIVFLGDLVHAPRPCQAEREWIESVLNELSGRAELIAVRGNHDRAFAREFAHLPIQTRQAWVEENLFVIHGDLLPLVPLRSQTLVTGHLHPCLPVLDAAGAGQKLPVFLVSPCCIILPAFSPFARGYNVACGLSAQLLPHFGNCEIHAYAATRTRVIHLGPLRRALQRMFEANVSAPAQFRKRRG